MGELVRRTCLRIGEGEWGEASIDRVMGFAY